MAAHQTDFSRGSVPRNILDVAVPITAAQVLNLLYNIVDRVYIGRIAGTGALALTGVGLCFPIITFISAFSMLYGANGGAPLCTIQHGRGNDAEAEAILGNSFTLLVGTGAAITVLGLVFRTPLLRLFGASAATLPYAQGYLSIYLLGTVCVMICLGMNVFINSQGFGTTGMLTVVLGAVLNLVLDPIFIFGLGMGVRGAALATVLSQAASAAWVLRFLTGKQAVLRLRLSCLRLQWRRVKRIVALGFSGFIMGMTNSVVQLVCNKMLALYGGDLYIGVMTVLSSVREVFQTPLMGLSSGAAPVMSYNYGARQYPRVRAAIRFITIVLVSLALAVWAVVFFFPTAFIRLFSADEALLAAAVPALRVYFFGFFMMALQSTGQNVFVALGKSKQAIFFSLLRKAIIVVPLTLVLPGLGLGVMGVFWAEPISNVVGGLACYCTMRHVVFPELAEPTDNL